MENNRIASEEKLIKPGGTQNCDPISIVPNLVVMIEDFDGDIREDKDMEWLKRLKHAVVLRTWPEEFMLESVFTELKTNTKRHYRQVREEFTGTGGGAKKVKPLLDYEERLLNLLSRTSVDGTDHLMEAGIPNSPQVGILEMEMPNENYKVDENVVSVEILPTSSIINIGENNFNCDNSLQAEVSTKGIQRQPKLRRQIRKCKVSRLDKSLQKFEELLQNQIEIQNKVAVSTDRLAAAIEALTGSISRGNLINFV
ncbi:hypothetical protein RN001_000589 [Aquatica leii]|uniref:Uncharacterized protein n=1 Tax=Aquatica leii TaxID=1421715 RepID=A0AAN7PFI9_9COLE|nr:hypothetical protein RN001_000589 [Aquatica leii]